MMTAAVIGAGQLGSRHLQGLLMHNQQLSVYVIDASGDSLKVAKERADEIKHHHEINFSTELDDLPETLDIAIVATSANVREKVVGQLLDATRVKYLILEKVLFQEVDSYVRVKNILSEKGVTTWVNHPRRMLRHYSELREQISGDPSQKIYSAVGGNWGLGCNGVHLLDLFTYLDRSSVADLDADYVDDNILQSKRPGFIEFTGTIRGRLKSGAPFSITSLAGLSSPLSVFVSSNNNRWVIQEGGTPQVLHFPIEKNFESISKPVHTEFQSSLTTRLIDSVLGTGQCALPSYAEATQCHIPFIQILLKKLNHLNNDNSTICPIT